MHIERSMVQTLIVQIKAYCIGFLILWKWQEDQNDLEHLKKGLKSCKSLLILSMILMSQTNTILEILQIDDQSLPTD